MTDSVGADAIAGRSLEELVEELAAPAPAASGGAAAAVTAALAASLVVMVGRGSPAWEAGADAATRAGDLRARLLRLADEDVAAFGAVLDAAREPGRPKLASALLAAATPPLGVAAAAVEVVELASAAAREGKGAMRSDAAVAARLATAAVEAGLLTVRVNLADTRPDPRARLIADEADAIQARLGGLVGRLS
jgi:formiminotetrahydrofolate cyclodeaminase